jgi:uncharacterized iron-regulated protein
MMRTTRACSLAAVLATPLLAACQLAPTTSAPPAAQPQALLLGEVHDNGEGHRQRADAMRARIEGGWRPVIAMEQFDREQQPELDAALRECSDAACVVARAAPPKSSWKWEFYEPVISLALAHGLPIRAANLSRAEAGSVIRDGIAVALDAELRARYDLEAGVPEPILAAQSDEVRSAHCGMLPEAMVEPMARAQIARDVVMAEAMRPHASRGVVLIAGNGHVRQDIAVPYWLRTQGMANWSVGYVETPGAPGEYDQEHAIPAAERPDPCAQFKPPAAPKG